MSKTIAIRVPDDAYSALEALCAATGQTMTQLLTPHILGLIDLPAAAPDPLEVRMAALETQMLAVIDRLEAIASEDKRSPVSDRGLNEGGTSTPEFTQYVEPILKPYSSGGYYFRFEDIGLPELKGTIQRQAKLLGFGSSVIKIGGESIRVWLNREHCLQSANTPQTPQ